MTRELVAWIAGQMVGTLQQLPDGRHAFAYSDQWLRNDQSYPISLSMPKRSEPFDDRSTRAFFGGLLPDDELRRRLARSLQVSEKNEFAMLAEVGRECAGAIALLPVGEQPVEPTGDALLLDDAAFAKLLELLPTRPLLVSDEVRLSLAGAQDKVAIRLEGDGFALPTDGSLTTHIVKVEIANYDDTVRNELFCMQLAASLKLPVPNTQMRWVGDTDVLVVERFDRERDEAGNLRRLHQEDFCQALAVPPEWKYQAEGGPGFVQLFDVVSTNSWRAALDRLLMLDMAQFHFLIGNTGAHGKNYSLLHTQRGVRLAPIYDAMSTSVYPNLSRRMAMKIGKKRELDAVRIEHWQAFAAEVGFAATFVCDRLAKVAQSLPRLARTLQGSPAFAGNATIAAVVDGIEARCQRMLPAK